MAFVAALSGGLSIGYTSVEEMPKVPDSISLAVMMTAGAATGIDFKKAKKKCRTIVGSYADSQSFTGNPEISTKLTVVEGDLVIDAGFDSKASQPHRTRNTDIPAENELFTFLGPFVSGSAGLFIGNGIDPDASIDLAQFGTRDSYLVGGIMATTGLTVATIREVYLRQCESAYLRQLDNIHGAGTIEIQ
ncbi:hypothetical protein H7Y63_00870 [Polaromonas sp.]|nr:hypothetical protein [Candidatus Saccharibacteria bacterium]